MKPTWLEEYALNWLIEVNKKGWEIQQLSDKDLTGRPRDSMEYYYAGIKRALECVLSNIDD